MALITILLVVIAIGVLLISDPGKRILRWSALIGGMGGLCYLLVGIVVISIETVRSNGDIQKILGVAFASAMIGGWVMYGIYRIWKDRIAVIQYLRATIWMWCLYIFIVGGCMALAFLFL